MDYLIFKKRFKFSRAELVLLHFIAKPLHLIIRNQVRAFNIVALIRFAGVYAELDIVTTVFIEI